MKKLKIFFIVYPLCILTSLFAYDSYEHSLIGDKVTLHGIDSNIFTLENNVDISFGDLIAMPDYYGKSDAPISVDSDKEKKISGMKEMEARFLDAYHSLSQGRKSEVEKILNMISTGKSIIINALKEGKTEEEAYKKLNSHEDVELEIITRGRYSSLAAENFDHFSGTGFQAARYAFLAGYNIAIKIVQDAQPTEIEKLKEAYCIYGFACHFLTDAFSSGHMRVPRFELLQDISGPFQKDISGLLAFFQHNEDGFYGINVGNSMGNWKAFGDSSLFVSEADELNMPVFAVQKGIDVIYNAFMKNPIESIDSIGDLIPCPAFDNFNPLFKVDKNTKKVLRRVDVSDRNCQEYTDDWYGLTTLLKLYSNQVSNKSDSYLTKSQLKNVKKVFDKVSDISIFELLTKFGGSSSERDEVASLPEVPDDEITN